LGVLTNRPFDAYSKGRLVRLTSFPTHDEVEVKGDLHIILGRAIEMEKRFVGYPKTPQGLQWAHALRDRLAEIDDLLIWKDVVFQQIYPTIRQAISRLPREQEALGQEYTQVMQELLRLVTWDLENLAEKKSPAHDRPAQSAGAAHRGFQNTFAKGASNLHESPWH